jgi:hypothetical protein
MSTAETRMSLGLGSCPSCFETAWVRAASDAIECVSCGARLTSKDLISQACNACGRDPATAPTPPVEHVNVRGEVELYCTPSCLAGYLGIDERDCSEDEEESDDE